MKSEAEIMKMLSVLRNDPSLKKPTANFHTDPALVLRQFGCDMSILTLLNVLALPPFTVEKPVRPN